MSLKYEPASEPLHISVKPSTRNPQPWTGGRHTAPPSRVRIPGRMPGACVHHALSLYFPVTCNPTRAVTLPNIGVPLYIGVPRRVTYPYQPSTLNRGSSRRSSLLPCVSPDEGGSSDSWGIPSRSISPSRRSPLAIAALAARVPPAIRERDRYFIAEQPAPAPHLAHPEGCAALSIVLVTVPRSSRRARAPSPPGGARPSPSPRASHPQSANNTGMYHAIALQGYLAHKKQPHKKQACRAPKRPSDCRARPTLHPRTTLVCLLLLHSRYRS